MIFIVVPVNGKVRLDITLDGEEIYCVYWVVHSICFTGFMMSHFVFTRSRERLLECHRLMMQQTC